MELDALFKLIKEAGIWAGMFIFCAWYFLNKYLPDERAARQKEREEEKQARSEMTEAFTKNLDRVISHTEKTQDKMSDQFVTVVGSLVGKIDGIDTTVKSLKTDIQGLRDTDGRIVLALEEIVNKSTRIQEAKGA